MKSCFSQACIWKGIIHFSVDSSFSHLGSFCFDFVEVQTNKCSVQQEMIQCFCSHASVPCPFLFFGGGITSLAAVSYKATREGTFQRWVNTIHFHLFLCLWVHSWPQSLASDCSDSTNPTASLLSCTCRETEISKDGVSTTYSQGHISKLGPTCESQIHGINCHADDFWEHGPHAWNTNLWPSWYKRPRNRKELSHHWELQSFHQSSWKNKFWSHWRIQAIFYRASLHLPCSLLQWLWQAQKWQASGVWLGGVYHNSIKQ